MKKAPQHRTEPSSVTFYFLYFDTSYLPISVRAVTTTGLAALATRFVLESCKDDIARCGVAVEGVVTCAGFSVEAVREAFVVVAGFGWGCIRKCCLRGSHSARVRATMGNSHCKNTRKMRIVQG